MADLEDRAALAAHLADKAAGRDGVSLDEPDDAPDRIDAEAIEFKDYLRSGPAFDDLEMDRAGDADPFGRSAVSSPRG